MVNAFLEWLNEFARGTEYLKLVVLSSAHHEPGIVLIPVKVTDAIGEATVHEESVRVSIFLQACSTRLTAQVDHPQPLPRSAQSQSC